MWTFHPLVYEEPTGVGFTVILGITLIVSTWLFLSAKNREFPWFGAVLVSGFLSFITLVVYLSTFCSLPPINEEHTAKFVRWIPQQEKETYSCNKNQTCTKLTNRIYAEFLLEDGSRILKEVNPNSPMPEYVKLYRQRN